MRIIDADGLVLGRMCSVVAKDLLNGDEITIVNAEKAIISGNAESIVEEYRQAKNRGKIRKGPYYPKMPDRILRRTVSRMMQHRKAHGKDAMSRLKVYIGVPDKLEKQEFEAISVAQKTSTLRKYMTLGDISRRLGAKL